MFDPRKICGRCGEPEKRHPIAQYRPDYIFCSKFQPMHETTINRMIDKITVDDQSTDR